MENTLVAASFRLPSDATSRYHSEGYYVFPPLLSPSGLQTLRERCDARQFDALNAGHDGSWLMEVQSVGSGDWLAQLLTEDAMRPLLTSFCGAAPCLESAQFFVKPPGAAADDMTTVVGWHQDATQDPWVRWLDEVHAADEQTFCDSSDDDDDGAGEPQEPPPPRPGPLTLWLPLDDVSAEGGGLKVLPRLHTHGALPAGPIYGACHGDSTKCGIGIDEAFLAARIHTTCAYELRAGQPAAHHAYTPHASGPNTTDAPRRVLILRILPLERTRARHATKPQKALRAAFMRAFLVTVAPLARERGRCAVVRAATRADDHARAVVQERGRAADEARSGAPLLGGA